MKVIGLFLTLIFFSLTLFAEEKLEKISLQLNWKYQYEFAGFIAAKEKGFYKDVGLDVSLLEFENNLDVIADLKDKKIDFAIHNTDSIYSNQDDKPLILLANYFKRSPLVLVTKQDIYTPYDLLNKKIMINSNELKSTSLEKLFNKFDLEENDFTVVEHSFNIEPFINNEVDAMTAFISNELYELRKAKVPFNVIDPAAFGILDFVSNLITLKEETEKHPLRTKNFIEATNKGWKYALENQDEIIQIIYENYSKRKDIEALKFEAKKTKNLMLLETYEVGSIPKRVLIDKINKSKSLSKLDDTLEYEDLVFKNNSIKLKNKFTEEEKKYLEEKSEITICIDPNWMPYEKIENAQHIGITKDYMDIFEKELNLPIRMVPTRSWTESLRYAKNRTCDILSLAMETESRKKYLNFTTPYFDSPLVIATRVNEMFIANIDDVVNTKKLGIVKGYAFSEILKKKYPKNKIVDVSSIDDGLNRVLKGEIFGFVDSLATVGYKIQNEYLGEVKIGGKLDTSLSLSIAVRNDDQVLVYIFEKLIVDFDDSKKHEILNKWINVKYDKGFDYTLLWQVIAIALLIIGFILYRNKELVKHQEQLEHKNDELLNTRNKLEETLSSYEVLLSSTMESIYVIEKDLCIDANEVGSRLLGYSSKEEILNKKIFSHIHPDSLFNLKKSFYSVSEAFEVTIIRADKTTFPALIKGNFASFGTRKVKVLSIVDLSELKHKEELLFKQSKLASMGEMVGNIAHQWRQPLSMISTVSTGIAFRLEQDISIEKNEMINDLQKLNSASQLLSKTIDDFRNFFLPDKKVQKFTTKELVESNLLILEPLFKNNYINLEVDYDKSISIETYQNELTQALLNILTNAKDALMDNQCGERYVSFKIYKTEKSLVIEIHDNAGGISENIDRIFEPYFTTKHQSHGTGIGLYMTHQIIEEHIHGKIEVTNSNIEYNNKTYTGALFRIFLPI